MSHSPIPDIFDEVIFKQNLHDTEGEIALDNLNKICKKIGYVGHGFDYGSNFEQFLLDNPGCVEAIQYWMAHNFTIRQMEKLGWLCDENDETNEENDDVEDDGLLNNETTEIVILTRQN
jgi:hypothetical protein